MCFYFGLISPSVELYHHVAQVGVCHKQRRKLRVNSGVCRMTLFDAEGWQTDTNTDCLNDSLFGQLTSAHKKGEKKEWRTNTNLQQHKNKNTKQSVKKGPKCNKKGPKCTKIEEKQIPNSKKSKSHDSSNSRNPLTCGTARTQTSAEQCHEQVEQSNKSQSKKKVNKRNKYRHLALKAAEEDVEVTSREMHTENKRSREQEKRKRKPTGMDDGTVQKVAKQTLSGDATSNSETPKKKKRKLKKGTSGHTKGGVLETVSGGSPPRHKRHVTVDVMGDVEAESADNAPVTFIGIRKSQTEAKRKRKRKTDDLKHSAEIATSIKNDLDSTSANLPPTATCVKGKAAARPASAATAVKKRSQYPFSIARLKSVFQHEATNTSNVSRDVPETEDASKTQENATKCKSDGNVPAQSSSPPQTLRERMQQKLNSARFRYINEQLYRRTGEEAHRLFTEDPETFQVYHEGYQSQIAKWPVNPVNKVIEYISSRPASLVVADLGCGDAKVSRAVPNRIHSFDLVAVNDSVTACDITQVPLEDNSVDIAVFCLSLMGTDFVQFLCEANRILRLGGKLLVAEVVSRFDKIGAFVRKLTKLGFSLQDKDTSNTMFVWFEFMKIGKPDLEKLPKIVLMPCVYKKR